MTKSTKLFRAGQWLAEVVDSLGSYRIIHNFITSKEALAAFLGSQQVMVGSEEGMVVSKNTDAIKFFHESISHDIESAGKFYNAQMVVLASTYIELILNDFFLVFFDHFPERMYEFLYAQEKEEQKGAVSLKEIIKVDSMPELINKLAEQATANLLKGGFTAQLNNLAKIIKTEVTADLKGQLNGLIGRRNRIVHEASKEEVVEKDVEVALDVCSNLIRYLAEVSDKNNIVLDEYNVFGLQN
jgi:uncharacterized protein (UPF0147 family)